MSLALQTNLLTKVYPGSPRAAVNGLTLEVRHGEIFGLLGPNGAGKTTALSILTGLHKYDSGQVWVEGFEIPRQVKQVKRCTGFVPQDIALYQTLTAVENLRIFGMIYGLKGKILKDRIAEYLDLVGLETTAGKPVRTFSGGMKKRLNLAAGLLHRPAIVLLDEPTVGVDVQSRAAILGYIKKLGGAGTTVIYTSHYLEEAEQLCDRVAIMDYGKKIAEGRPADLLSQRPGTASLQEVFIQLTGRELRD